ncbi:hypothetical protein [Bacillus weihaiensis]|uniref:hypothetical protein n=1 Tax=Bacillus weihaiensis TaxID=1547283 RepID=UPI0023566AEC|nr:hypothetical protein [Bacillus weihaiensis]
MGGKSDMASLLINMPLELREDFKTVLKKNGSNMNAVVRILIGEYIEKMELLEGDRKHSKKVIKRMSSKKKGVRRYETP